MTLYEDYGWTPPEIDEIPYKKLQTILLLRRLRNEATNKRLNTEKAKSRVQGGGPKKFIREI